MPSATLQMVSPLYAVSTLSFETHRIKGVKINWLVISHVFCTEHGQSKCVTESYTSYRIKGVKINWLVISYVFCTEHGQSKCVTESYTSYRLVEALEYVSAVWS